MLTLTQLAGFGSGGGGGTDATPNAIDFADISASDTVAVAFTNVVTIGGIDMAITLRLTLTAAMAAKNTVSVYRDGALVATGNSGTTIDVDLTNAQTLQYAFANTQNSTIWSGTASVSNLSAGGAVLDTFAYTLEDTGTGGVAVTS